MKDSCICAQRRKIDQLADPPSAKAYKAAEAGARSWPQELKVTGEQWCERFAQRRKIDLAEHLARFEILIMNSGMEAGTKDFIDAVARACSTPF